MRKKKTFRIGGRVIERLGRAGAPGLRVEAWDRDTNRQDLLGEALTDVDGRFRIVFDENAFGDVRHDRLPDLFFRIFHGENLVKDTSDSVRWNVSAGDIPIDFEVDLDVHQRAMLGGTMTTSSMTTQVLPSSTEVAIHELGESIAATIATVQQELERYPNPLGTYVLDEVEMNIPLLMRVDAFGQVMATVTEKQSADSVVGQMRLRLRPVLGAKVPPPVTSSQTLESLGVLTPEAIEELNAQRVFSVNDLMRVTGTAGGRTALSKVNLGAPVDSVIDRAKVVTLPMLSSGVGESLLRLGIERPGDILKRDPEMLAKDLARHTDLPILPQDVSKWQQQVEEFLRVPLPSTMPDSNGTASQPGTGTVGTPDSVPPPPPPKPDVIDTLPRVDEVPPPPIVKPETPPPPPPVITPPPTKIETPPPPPPPVVTPPPPVVTLPPPIIRPPIIKPPIIEETPPIYERPPEAEMALRSRPARKAKAKAKPAAKKTTKKKITTKAKSKSQTKSKSLARSRKKR